jgi:hypothetical protein
MSDAIRAAPAARAGRRDGAAAAAQGLSYDAARLRKLPSINPHASTRPSATHGERRDGLHRSKK